MRELFLLDPEVVFLNHGSFGATPRPVFEEYQRRQLELEREPVEFLSLKRRFPALIEHVRARLAEYVGARTPGSGPRSECDDRSESRRSLARPSVTSPTALRVPVEQICAGARDTGVPVLVVGAHAPSQLDLDVEAIGADWYTGNCHK